MEMPVAVPRVSFKNVSYVRSSDGTYRLEKFRVVALVGGRFDGMQVHTSAESVLAMPVPDRRGFVAVYEPSSICGKMQFVEERLR